MLQQITEYAPMMSQDSSLITRLPLRIFGKDVDLLTVSLGTWADVEKLRPDERKALATGLNMMENGHSGFANKAKYYKLCANLRDLETTSGGADHPPHRFYWVRSARLDCLVGDIQVFIPANSRDTLAIGYSTLPAYRKQGFATAAVELLSSTVLKQKLVGSICAETMPDNGSSGRVLLRAGFREMAAGICTTRPSFNNTVRRFLKTRSGFYPVWPIGSVRPL